MRASCGFGAAEFVGSAGFIKESITRDVKRGDAIGKPERRL